MRASPPPPPGSCRRCPTQNPPSAGQTPTSQLRPRTEKGVDDDPPAGSLAGSLAASGHDRPQPVELAAADPHRAAAAHVRLQPRDPAALRVPVLLLVPAVLHAARGRDYHRRLPADQTEELTCTYAAPNSSSSSSCSCSSAAICTPPTPTSRCRPCSSGRGPSASTPCPTWPWNTPSSS